MASSSRKPGHLPAERGRIQLVQQRQRHPHGHPVVRPARREHVVQRQVVAVRPPGLRERVRVRRGRAGGQVVPGHRQQVGVLLPGPLPPRVEVRRGDDAVGHPGGVEGEDGLVVDQQVAASGPLLQRLDLGPQRLVGREEGVPGPPLPLDQRGAEEDLPGLGRVDLAVADPAPGHDRHAEQADGLVRQHRPAAGGPVRLGVLPLEQVLADLLHLLGGDRRRPYAPRAGWSRPARRRPPAGGGVRARLEPGLIANRAPRAPRYSCGPGRRRRPPPVGRAGSRTSASPTWDSSPASAAVCTRSGGAGTSLRVMSSSPTICLSWPCRSCHSRTRRKCRYSSRQSRRNALPDRALRWVRR